MTLTLLEEHQALINKGTEIRRVTATRDSFQQITGIEPVPESTETTQLRTSLVQKAEQMLRPWVDRGLVAGNELDMVTQTWQNAALLDGDGMNQFGKFDSGLYRRAAGEMAQLDPKGQDVDTQNMIKRAQQLADSKESEATRALALTYKPTALIAVSAGVDQVPNVLMMVNKDKVQSNDPATLNAVAYEETAHMVSKLSMYPGANRKWVEETMARVIAFGGGTAHQNESRDVAAGSAKILRSDDYHALFNLVSGQVGDGGEALVRMYFGREPVSSPLVSAVQTAVENVDMIGQIVDAGVSISDLTKSMDKKLE